MYGRFRQSLRLSLLRRRAVRAIRRIDPKDAIIITGLTRSGSTWLEEAIGAWEGTICLFEPIHKRVPATRAALTLGDGNGSHDEPASPDEAAALDAILRGEVLDAWTLQGTVVPRRPRRLCVKLINCNNGISRIVGVVRPRRCPIVLLRHPCAHVASWRRLGWSERFNRLESRFPRVLAAEPHLREALAGLSDPVDLMAAAWCLGNRLPLTRDPQGRWKVVRYESLRDDPEGVLADLFAAWNEPGGVPQEILKVVGRPSRTTWREGTSPPETGTSAGGWKEELSVSERERVYEVCSRFGVQVDEGHYGVRPGV